jgi:hypothetical protein
MSRTSYPIEDSSNSMVGLSPYSRLWTYLGLPALPIPLPLPLPVRGDVGVVFGQDCHGIYVRGWIEGSPSSFVLPEIYKGSRLMAIEAPEPGMIDGARYTAWKNIPVSTVSEAQDALVGSPGTLLRLTLLKPDLGGGIPVILQRAAVIQTSPQRALTGAAGIRFREEEMGRGFW